MKILGFILLGLQLLAYFSRSSKMFEHPSIGYILGFNVLGIAGIILLLIAYNKDTKNQGE